MRQALLPNIPRVLDKIPVRWRLTLGHGVWIGLIFLVIGFGVNHLIRKNVLDSLDTTLLTTGKTIRDAGLSTDHSRLTLRNSPFWWSILDEFYDGEYFAVRSFAQLVDLSGNISAKVGTTSVRLPVTPLSLSRAERGLETFETFDTGFSAIPRIRQVTLPVLVGGRFTGELIQVGAPINTTLAMLNRVKIILFLSLSLALCMTVFFGYLLARRALSPLRGLTRAAEKIGVEDLSERLPVPAAKDEFQRLILTYNTMLERLEDAFGRLRRFAGDVSHELRTPLAVLRGEAELALRKERSCDDYRDALHVISDESRNMSKIVEDLLLLARAHGRSLELQKESLDCLSFVKGIEQDLSKNLAAKDLELVIDCSENFMMDICPTYLSVALKNLLLNAIKHSPHGAKIEWNIRATILAIEFSIRDYGEGIALKDRPYVFDAFYRADTVRNRKLGGTGIGLSLAKALVKLHGGEIIVSEPDGKGALFTIKLPRHGSQIEALP